MASDEPDARAVSWLIIYGAALEFGTAGRLVETAADWQAILSIGEDLSIAHTKKYLTRSLISCMSPRRSS
jgi:hypothetical protein